MLNSCLKNTFYLLCLALATMQVSCNNESITKKGKYFYKISANSEHNPSISGSFYKLERIDTAKISYYSYPDAVKIEMIAELLSFEGDTTPCAKPFCLHESSHFSSLSSFIPRATLSEKPSYPIQVEALFLINQIYFEKPFEYSSTTALVNSQELLNSLLSKYPNIAKMNKEELHSIENGIAEVESACLNTKTGIHLAFQLYKAWFQKIKAAGKLNKLNIKPLNDSIYWYYAVSPY